VQGLGLPVELLQLGGQQACLRLQRTGRGGGPGFAPAAVEQLQVQLGLQLGNGHADGRRHAPQLRAAAENEPLSSTARNSGTCSEEKPCRAIYQ
jgi:hypothetical protein